MRSRRCKAKETAENEQNRSIRSVWRICGMLASLCCLCVLLSACSKKYLVTVNMNGGSLVSGELIQMVREGEAAAPPAVENKDQRLSWDRNFSNITEDTVITAQWAPPAYTVRFDLNGGELISGETEQIVEAGASAIAPEVKNGIQQLSWDTDFSCISGDTVVTAQWKKVKLDEKDLVKYVQKRTATVNIKWHNGESFSCSGFFIDEKGTLVTLWSILEGAEKISVTISGGREYHVAHVVDFDDVLNLAILQIDVSNSPYLELCGDTVSSGEKVYAVGSPFGTLTGLSTSGGISSTERELGNVGYLQMEAAISGGNRGGPLVNEYGEVVGVNAYAYENGERLNVAIKIETLAKLKRDKNWTVQEFIDWYAEEEARSYSPWDGEDDYFYSTIHTYQTVTGRECLASVKGEDEEIEEGYVDCRNAYIYEYEEAEYDQYVDYLKEIGFVFDDSDTGSSDSNYWYYKERDNVIVLLYVNADKSLLEITVRQM